MGQCFTGSGQRREEMGRYWFGFQGTANISHPNILELNKLKEPSCPNLPTTPQVTSNSTKEGTRGDEENNKQMSMFLTLTLILCKFLYVVILSIFQFYYFGSVVAINFPRHCTGTDCLSLLRYEHLALIAGHCNHQPNPTYSF